MIAHGTGTPVGDAAEILAINQAYGARPLPVTSIKGHIGHTMGASGVMSLIAGLYAMRDGVLPQTLGTSDPDPQAAFSLVVGQPRRARLAAVQINAFGFGGQDASIVVTAEGA